MYSRSEPETDVTDNYGITQKLTKYKKHSDENYFSSKIIN